MNRVEREALLRRLRRDAERITAHFGLEYRAIEAERRGVKARYGACYEDGLIKVRLQHAKTGDQLKYSSLIDTLCHELAHLRHFDHGKEFKRLYLQILRWARRQGIYRPRSRQVAEGAPPPKSHLAPEQKNGVPVFAGAPDLVRRPAWMKAILDVSRAAAPTPSKRPAPKPRPAPAPRHGVLPLFASLDNGPAPAPVKRRRAAGKKGDAERREAARGRQLSLF